MSKRILFDGLNLALKRGTGIAVYTRVLVHLTRELGHRAGILFSRKSGLPREELDREVAFFDAELAPSMMSKLRAAVSIGSYISTATGIHPQRVPLTGAVITQPLGSSWVACDDVYSATRVFDRARALFDVTGQFLKVKMPDSVDLFHWTSPLPIISNARANVYTIHDIIPLRLP